MCSSAFFTLQGCAKGRRSLRILVRALISRTSTSRRGDSLPEGADDFGADLGELAVTAFLRALAAELGPIY
jgi:hypothetical protein